MTTPANEPLRADGTDQPVVGSPFVITPDRLSRSADETPNQEWVPASQYRALWIEWERMTRKHAEIDMQLAAHRYALSLQNKCAGLPENNEAYNRLPELLDEVRACLVEALKCIHGDGTPWREDYDRWRKAAGLNTANESGQLHAGRKETT